MSQVIGILAGVQLKPFVIPFLQKPIESAVDVTSLDMTMYTDFVARKEEFEINWAVLTDDEYNALRAIYNAQFSTGTYPVFEIPYYSINTQVRMYINDKDIRKDGCQIRNVQIRLVQKAAS
jgi:hypothetical protein